MYLYIIIKLCTWRSYFIKTASFKQVFQFLDTLESNFVHKLCLKIKAFESSVICIRKRLACIAGELFLRSKGACLSSY